MGEDLSRGPWHGEHHMQRDSQSLRTMDMRKAGWICNDGICHERPAQAHVFLAGTLDPVLNRLIRALDCHSIACLVTRSPAALDHFGDLFAPLADVSAAQTVEARHESGVFDHERHELCGIPADAEEFKVIFFDEFLESWMRRQSYAVIVGVLEDLSKSHERLYISPRPYDVYNDIQWGWRGLSWLPAEGGRNVRGRWRKVLSLSVKLMSKSGYKDFGQPVRVLVNCDIDTAIGSDSCVGPNIPVLFNNLAIGVAVRWRGVRVSFA